MSHNRFCDVEVRLISNNNIKNSQYTRPTITRINNFALSLSIGKGKLYKYAKRKLEDDDNNDTQVIVTEEKIVDMYKHISLPDVYYTADPVTKEPTMPLSSKMEEFMKTTDGEWSPHSIQNHHI